MPERTRRMTAVAVAALVIGFAVIVVASSGDGAGGGRVANNADGAFITGMVAHDRAAVELAQLGGRRARRGELRGLARRIASERRQEIDELDAEHRRIYGQPVPAGGMPHGGAGAGETGTPDLDQLARARPFDRAFIDAMVRHHEAAVRMARTEVDRGGDPLTRRLAERIIATRSGEIARMRAWRSTWYGGR